MAFILLRKQQEYKSPDTEGTGVTVSMHVGEGFQVTGSDSRK